MSILSQQPYVFQLCCKLDVKLFTKRARISCYCLNCDFIHTAHCALHTWHRPLWAITISFYTRADNHGIRHGLKYLTSVQLISNTFTWTSASLEFTTSLHFRMKFLANSNYFRENERFFLGAVRNGISYSDKLNYMPR